MPILFSRRLFAGSIFAAGFLALQIVPSNAANTNLPALTGGRSTLVRYFPAPNFRQVEVKFMGDKVQSTNQQFRAVNADFSAYETNGLLHVQIKSPLCIYDESNPRARKLNSSETLQARSGDGRFQIDGRGFEWQQNEKWLIISNDVRAVIRYTNSAPPLEITSRWLEFDVDTGRAIFHDDVQGDDTLRSFTCKTLTVAGNPDSFKATIGSDAAKRNRLAKPNPSQPFDFIEAEGDLVITGKANPGYAKAQRGSFRQSDQRIDLIGDAAWSMNNYAGSADQMTVWLSNTNIDASGKVQLRLPAATLGAAGGLLNTTNSASRSATNIVTVNAERFNRRGEQLLAEGGVRISDGTNQLTCDRLEGHHDPRHPDAATALATGNVFVGRNDGGVRAERAEYSKAEDQVLFTGNPRFEQGQASGTAGRIVARPSTRTVNAENGVVVYLTFAGNEETFLNVLPGSRTNHLSRPTRTNQIVRVTAQDFSLRDQIALFSGNVTAHQLPQDGAEPRLKCDELEVRLAANRRHAEAVQARGEIVCERGRVGVTNGTSAEVYTRMTSKTLTARTDGATGNLIELVADGGVQLDRSDLVAQGERAVFTQADQLLKLLGQSVIENTQAIYKSSQGLAWHIATEQVVGTYDSIRFKPEALKRVEQSPTLPTP